MSKKMENIQLSTFNTERRRVRLMIPDWMLNVECWALNVFHFGNGGFP